MGAKKGRPKPKGSGRVKGTPNKLTASFKEVMSRVLFDDPAKTEKKLIELRDSHEAADRATFWRMATKMLPQQIDLKGEFDDLPVVTFSFAGRKIDGGDTDR